MGWLFTIISFVNNVSTLAKVLKEFLGFVNSQPKCECDPEEKAKREELKREATRGHGALKHDIF